MNGSGLATPGEQFIPFGPPLYTPPDPTIIRIPVAGPAPFNTLAVFTHLASNASLYNSINMPLEQSKPDNRSQITPLRINGFKKNSSEQQRVVHSCAVTAFRASLGDDNDDFVLAADDIGRPNPAGGSPVEIEGSGVDSEGNWSINLTTVLGTAITRQLAGDFELRCWVLFFEAEPPSPLSPDEEIIRENALSAARQLLAYSRYIGLDGADLWKAAQELEAVERQLSGAGYPDQALEAAQLIVNALRAYTPGTDGQLDYVISFAEARHNLIFRLVEAGQATQAAALAGETVAGYRQYSSMPGADIFRLDTDLTELSKELTGIAEKPAALGCEQIDVEALRSFVPPVDRELDYSIRFAEARQNLIVRFIDVGQLAAAAALVDETLAGYQRYAALSGADLVRVSRDLSELASGLAAAGETQAANAVIQVQTEMSLQG